MILVGMKECCGTFTDKKTKENVDYHNIVMYVSDDIAQSKDVVGSFGNSVSEIKVKGQFLDSAFGGKFLGVAAYEKYLGSEIKVFYDNYKNCNYVVLPTLPDEPKKAKVD